MRPAPFRPFAPRQPHPHRSHTHTRAPRGRQTGGPFQYVRHPIYSGLLLACVGLSLLTGSADRLVLTAVLYVILDRKAAFEEAALEVAYPDYSDYKSGVRGKLVPSEVAEWLRGVWGSSLSE